MFWCTNASYRVAAAWPGARLRVFGSSGFCLQLRVVARSTEAALQRTELLAGAQEKGCWVWRAGGGVGACRGEEDNVRGHGEEG
nr:unnamed protein product [Digitaria exilis]